MKCRYATYHGRARHSPGLVCVRQGRQQDEEGHDRDSHRRSPNHKHDEQAHLLPPRYDEAHHRRDGEGEHDAVGDHVEDGYGEVQGVLVDAGAAPDGAVPALGDGVAAEDQGEDGAERVAGHDDHGQDDEPAEPRADAESAVVQQKREFRQAGARGVDDRYH